MRARLKTIARWLLTLSAAVVVCAAALAAGLMNILRPAPGEWAETVRWGRWHKAVSMPTLLRMATHPFTLSLLQGRSLDTRFGPVQWAAGAKPGNWVIVCAPCSLQRAELGRDRIHLARAEFTLERDVPTTQMTQMSLRGSFALGETPQAVRGRWSARVDTRRADVKFELPATPMAHAFGLFGSVIPELSRTQIDGSLALSARLSLPSRELSLQPRIDGFNVSGLGTEALAGAVPACAPNASAGSFGTWLPRAVIAAEDQRFYEHPGYDLAEIIAAWSARQDPARRQGEGEGGVDGEHARGASTLSQQLAKLVYTGDAPSHARKLRELLYAVELDRTLGKARVLSLYLAIAPWGDGQCGAQAAAMHLLGKRAAELSPLEAAWLASLLRNPNAALVRLVSRGEVDGVRVGGVLAGMRPMSAQRREAALAALETWRPAWMGSARPSALNPLK